MPISLAKRQVLDFTSHSSIDQRSLQFNPKFPLIPAAGSL